MESAKQKKKTKRYFHLLDELGEHCIYCNERMLPKVKVYKTPPPLYPTVEHVIPRYLGGTWDLTNLVLACYSCNHIKGNAAIPKEIITPEMAELFQTRKIKKHLIYPETGSPELHVITKQQLLTRIEWRPTWHTDTKWNSRNLQAATRS